MARRPGLEPGTYGFTARSARFPVPTALLRQLQPTALAKRSATAAKEIKQLVAKSVSSTAQGASQVGTAGETIDRIVSAIAHLTHTVQEIALANKEQSLGVGQVGEAIAQIDRVTQQNAALVEESAAAAASLDSQAQDLVREVAVFNVSGQHTVPLSKSKNFPSLQPLSGG